MIDASTLGEELAGHADPNAGERMLREARVSARIQSPNVVGCYDFGFPHAKRILWVFRSAEPMSTGQRGARRVDANRGEQRV